MMITLEGRSVEYSILRNRRARRVKLRVEIAQGLVVVIPWRFPAKEVPSILLENARWILRILDRQHTILDSAPALVSANGTVRLAGCAIPLKVEPTNSRRVSVALDAESLHIALPPFSNLNTVIEAWYRRHARTVFAEKVREWSLLIGVQPVKLKIGDPRSRWGSCSTRGTISLSWRLLLAPSEVMDYVIVHELCHMKQRNHSPHFWKLVESILPDLSARRLWLRENGTHLRAAR